MGINTLTLLESREKEKSLNWLLKTDRSVFYLALSDLFAKKYFKHKTAKDYGDYEREF
jgi:hypothetical protein